MKCGVYVREDGCPLAPAGLPEGTRLRSWVGSSRGCEGERLSAPAGTP